MCFGLGQSIFGLESANVQLIFNIDVVVADLFSSSNVVYDDVTNGSNGIKLNLTALHIQRNE